MKEVLTLRRDQPDAHLVLAVNTTERKLMFDLSSPADRDLITVKMAAKYATIMITVVTMVRITIVGNSSRLRLRL